MLQAFVDASERESGVFTVAGYAFGYDGASKAANKWQKRMNGRTFHMTDLSARKGEFEGFTRQESGQLLKDLVAILNKHSKFCAAVSIKVDEIGARLPGFSTDDHGSRQVLKGFRTPYAFCVHMFMTHLNGLVHRNGGSAKEINYIFETGDKGEGDVREYLSHVEGHQNRSLRDMYCMNSFDYAKKESPAVLLQCADFLSWEWSKHVDRRAQGKNVRPSLMAALGGGFETTETEVGYTANSEKDGYAICSHYTGETTKKFLDDFQAVMLSKSVYQVSSVVNRVR